MGGSLKSKVPNTTSSWYSLMDDPSVGVSTIAPMGEDLSAGGEDFSIDKKFLMDFCFFEEDFLAGEDLVLDVDSSVSSPLFDIL